MLVGGRDGAEQTSPGEMNVYLVGDAVEFFGEIFDGGLHEHCIRQAAFSRLPRRLHRRFLERFRVRVDADVELVRVLARRNRHKAPVAGPDVDHNPFAGTER